MFKEGGVQGELVAVYQYMPDDTDPLVSLKVLWWFLVEPAVCNIDWNSTGGGSTVGSGALSWDIESLCL